MTVEADVEHPFFVFGKGWSSAAPEKTMNRYKLPCRQLKVGDECVSLTHKELMAAAAANLEVKKEEEEVEEEEEEEENMMPPPPPPAPASPSEAKKRKSSSSAQNKQSEEEEGSKSDSGMSCLCLSETSPARTGRPPSIRVAKVRGTKAKPKQRILPKTLTER